MFPNIVWLSIGRVDLQIIWCVLVNQKC